MEEQTLRIEIPSCDVTKPTPEDPEWIGVANLNGWNPVSIGGGPSLVLGWEGIIDLSGYARDYKTFYPDGGVIQEGPYWTAFDGFGQTVCTVVSSIPIDLEQLALTLVSNSTPGLIVNSTGIGTNAQNWETTLFCETQVNLINSTLPALGICQPITQKQTGSLSPTAAQVLYVAKIVIPATVASATGTTLSIPASRIILPGKMDQEAELPYMMRLSRSIELANQV
jgi:hypothetical protein